MYVLGIETSCDETSAAVIEVGIDGDFRLLSEEISSQTKLHELYGGVVPELASREHLSNLPLVVDKVLRDAALGMRELSGIGATRGPGLKGCLLVGYGYAKALALTLELPFVGINHLEGHILSGVLDNPTLTFPFLCLIVSGGHTEIVEVRSLGRYSVLARTLDDAAGEAFDKSASLLGLAYPGGAKLAALADSLSSTQRTLRPDQLALPKVMREAEGFSFSGLKTAIALLVERSKEQLEDQEFRAQIAAVIQEAIVETLIHKLKEAVKKTGIARVVVAGGVSANRRLRERVQNLRGVESYFPSITHCMDNAAMIAYAAALRLTKGERTSFNAAVMSRWPLEEIAPPMSAHDA